MSNEFDELGYEKFRVLATRKDLTRHEKVGFPDEYREGKEENIFTDIRTKLSSLDKSRSVVLEIGPGCSQLPLMLIELCRKNRSNLLLVDSDEMLSLLPSESFVIKIPGKYPNVESVFDRYVGKIETIIVYSVIQYVFVEGNLWDFLDRSLMLLAEGGEMLLGDIPNISMRKRFFTSAAGACLHREYTGRDEKPEVMFNIPEPGQIDDSIVLAILARARIQGFHAWVTPQSASLPMANRREDILIRRP